MPAVSESIVREFFELHGFLVCQQRKHTGAGRDAEEDIDFFVSNPRPAHPTSPVWGVLTSEDLPRIAQAVVVVKGWHTETFGPSIFTHAPEIFRFVEAKTLRQAEQFFGSENPFTKIMVVPALPRGTDAREQTLALLRTKGVDAVIPFHTILRNLIESVEVNRNYQKSDLLQTLRILKNYGFFKENQLELFRPTRKDRRNPAGSEHRS
jgi:hypothetical protein